MNEIVNLAKKAINKYVTDGSIVKSDDINNELTDKKAGCFVSIHSKDNNELRGCIGTILPTCKNLSAEIINNAVSACQDTRFLPINKRELSNLEISVDVLDEPEPIESINLLDPKKYGVIVKAKDGRTGLLLPDLDGIDEANYQVAVAKEKAGISTDEPTFLYRFSVTRYKE